MGKSMITYGKILISWILIILMFYCDKQRTPANLVEIHGRTMGTTYMVKIVKPDELQSMPAEEFSKNITAEIETLLKNVNQQMSAWLEDSEISRFNRYRESQWFEVSADTAAVIAEALKVSDKSNGAFDITVAPLVNLWGFGPGKTGKQIPGEEQIKEAMKKIGYQKLSVCQAPPSLKKEEPGLYCDLSAIAKGFGVDKIAGYLDVKGFSHYLVEIGGEVRAKGVRPDGQPWRVAIASPDPRGSSPYQKIIQLKDTSMATSGDYFNYFEKDGVRYSHTIDPTTGKPITHKLASVTVIHESCMIADAMATAINVMGPGKGYELALKENLAVFMIVRGKSGFLENMTSRFEEMMRR
ncbi:MAG: FAD:protein FMN transferase [Candidatus Aminicenantes bacterium]|nr:MAG: FAD:protein FMN transferase [Candidatus Aminicenantes bacterium]